jgi:hypothetical protein
METQEYRIEIDQRVRLKSDGQDALYQRAYAGSEGWARKHKKDEFGYPMIYVEWDKNHWAYNGEKDRWALEAHFDPVEESKVSETPTPQGDPDFNKFMEFMYTQFQQQAKDHQPDAPVEEVADTDEGTEDEFQAAAQEAGERAGKSESFLLITASYEQAGEEQVLVPRVMQCYKTDESALLLEMQLPHLAMTAHQQLAIQEIHRKMKEKGE